MNTLTIEILGQHFSLHPDGAAFWVEQRMLLVADVHLGKTAHFRKHGFAVPHEVAHYNFQKLDNVLQSFEAEKVIFLGDLFHSYVNQEWEAFQHWVARQHVAMTLVSGNHDIIPQEKYETLGIDVTDVLSIGAFVLTHHPETHEGFFNICGHVHPGVRLKGKGKQALSLPCFYHEVIRLVLPALGAFTGKFIVKPKKGESVYGIVGEKVMLLTTRT